jgi:hypothetical protein
MSAFVKNPKANAIGQRFHNQEACPLPTGGFFTTFCLYGVYMVALNDCPMPYNCILSVFRQIEPWLRCDVLIGTQGQGTQRLRDAKSQERIIQGRKF